jgi:hypothetical protein
MEPRTIVGQSIGEGEQLGPDGLRRHHPGAIVNRKAVRMRGIGTLRIVNSIRVSSARRRRATRDVLPSDTAIRSGKVKDETAHVLAGPDGYDGPGMGHRRSARIGCGRGRVGVRSAAAVPGDHARLIILVASDWHQD